MPRQILHLDDQPALPSGLARALAKEGFTLRQETDAQRARAALLDPSTEIALVEPLVAGAWELLEEARRASPRVEAIVVTRAARDAETYGRALELGVEDFLCKPVLRAQLLESVLAAEARRAQAAEANDEGPGEDVLGEKCGVAPAVAALAALRARGESGVLGVASERGRFRIELRNGSVAACAKAKDDAFDAYLLREGAISQRARDAAAKRAAVRGATVRDALVEAGALSEDDADRALRAWAEEPFWAACAEPQARCTFVPNAMIRPADSLEVESDTAQLLFDAARRHCDEAAARAWLAERRAAYAVRAHGAGLRGRAQGDKPAELVATLADERTVGEILAAQDVALCDLVAALLSGWAELVEPIEWVEETGVNAGDAAARAPSTRGAEVAAALAAARAPRAPAGETSERSLEAEEWFRKGKAALAGRKHAEAAEAFGMATHLDPNDGEYLAHLGYALYLTRPGDETVEREALEQIARGVKLSPGRELPYVFLGRIFKASGNAAMARKMFRRALKIRPECHPALQELRLLEMRNDKQKGAGGFFRS